MSRDEYPDGLYKGICSMNHLAEKFQQEANSAMHDLNYELECYLRLTQVLGEEIDDSCVVMNDAVTAMKKQILASCAKYVEYRNKFEEASKE